MGGHTSGPPGVLNILRRRLLAHPGRAAFVIATVGLAAGVCINALALQDGAHPNPMFGTGKPATILAHPSTTAVVRPAPAQARQPPAPQAATAAAVQVQAPAQQAVAAPVVAPPPAVRQRDVIGDLLRGGAAPTPPPRPVANVSQPPAAPRPAPSPQLSSAQKALTKMGYGPLTADGLMGAGTRGAIERFEKAKGLPVTGELGPRTLKALSGAAAAPVR